MAAMPDLGMSVLPGSVVAAHLQASAESLADGTAPRRVDQGVGTAGELAAIIERLITAQYHISAALARLGDYARDRGLDGSLADVLTASARASGYAGDALAESRPLMRVVLDVTGEETRL